MTIGLRGPPGSPSADPDFCVVATRLGRQSRSAEPPAGKPFPDLRQNVRSSSRTPLFHQHTTQSKGNTRQNSLVPTAVAPFAGQISSTSDTLFERSPGKARCSSGGAGLSKGGATTSVPAADGDSQNSNNSCRSETPGRTAGAAPTDERGLWGRSRSASAAMTPKLVNDPGKTPTNNVVSSKVCLQPSKRYVCADSLVKRTLWKRVD